MRVMVLADTHVHMLEQLPKKVIDALSAVDLIIHAGDFTDVQLLKELNQLGKVKAVHGNMDSTELKTMRIDIIIYGHSHISQNKVIDRILFFNPGKATDSFGIITIDGEAKAEIVNSRL